MKTITIEKITSKLTEFNKKYDTPTDIMTIAFLNEEALLPSEVAKWYSSIENLEIVGGTPAWITNF